MSWSRFVLPDDWGKIFAIDTPLLEVFARITVVYFFLVLLLRVTLKREAGGTSLRDLLVLVLIADAVQNGMAGEYKSVGDALVIGGRSSSGPTSSIGRATATPGCAAC